MQARSDRRGIALDDEMVAVIKRGERDQPQYTVGHDDQGVDPVPDQHRFQRAHDALVQLASGQEIFVCCPLFEQLTKCQYLLAQLLRAGCDCQPALFLAKADQQLGPVRQHDRIEHRCAQRYRVD